LSSVQKVQTQFGDNLSEMDAAWSKVEGGRLYVMLTGNLEGNFNKLGIFIDSRSFGQNQIGGSNPTNDNWATSYGGFTFDTGFAADYMMIMRRGFAGVNKYDVDLARVGGGANDYASYQDIFNDSQEGSASLTDADRDFGSWSIGSPLQVAYDNSNVAGVAGGTNAADQSAAQAVLTGIEFSIALSDLGNPANPSDIKISVMVNGGNHDYLSNQFLGSLEPPQGNLGGDGNGNFNGTVGMINLNNFAGQQFFVVPEPATLALMVVGGLAVVRRRR
jgi:hypothetical protein